MTLQSTNHESAGAAGASIDRALATARLWWSVPASVLLALVMVAAVIGRKMDPFRSATSYDASNDGFRAAFLLLEDLGYPVERSNRPTGGAARFVFSPDDSAKEFEALRKWVQDGGCIVLADSTGSFSKQLGIPLEVEKQNPDPGEQPASGEGLERINGGEVRVSWPGHDGRVWAKAGGAPLITVHSFGNGEVWLVHRPRVVSNKLLREADNALLLCRASEAILANRTGPLLFDEFVHGQRDRPGVIELLLRPPALAVTLQTLLFMVFLLWHHVPRFGTIQPVPPPRRRSKEEFLDAMANLLERKGDLGDAFRTARTDLARRIEEALGLPPTTPMELLAREAAKRRPIDEKTLLSLLSTDTVSPDAFLRLMNELETAHDELFDRRNHR
jgi:hypothetical protein